MINMKVKMAVAISGLSLLLTGCTGGTFDGYVHSECSPTTESANGKVTTCSVTEKPVPTETVTQPGPTVTVPGPTQTVTVTPTPSPTATTASPSPTATTPPATTPPASNEKVITNAFVTGYTWYDNTPPGTSQIAYEDVRPGTGAGGTGTYANPITIAVGHVKNAQGVSTPDYPKGTIFYIPNVRKYFIVEDLCGDGATPQNIPCHNLDAPGNDAPAGATTWVDIWVDGRSRTETQATACANKITKLQTIIQNPDSNYVVVTGALADTQAVQGNGTLAYCPTYSNTPVRQ